MMPDQPGRRARATTATIVLCAALIGALAGCASRPSPPPQTTATARPDALPPGMDPDRAASAYSSTYRSIAAGPVAIVGAHVMPATGPQIDDGTIVLSGGRILAIGPRATVAIPAGAEVVEAQGRWVTPGIVDPHSHVGMNMTFGHDNANEMTNPVNPGLWVEHSIWPQDPMFERALAGGVTTLQILPGSAGMINGRTAILRNVPAVSVDAMKFPGATPGLKLACGENPMTVYGGRGQAPMTRAGEMLGFRKAFIDAIAYSRQWDDYRRKVAGTDGAGAEPPARDVGLDALADVLRGKLAVHIHCYRADDMMRMIALSHEFGFHITAFHHAIEAYKIAAILAREHIGVVTWAGDWSGYKMEAFDAIAENASAVEAAGGLATMHSDDPQVIQHLNAEAARTFYAAARAGFGSDPMQALRWITINPARLLGVDKETGSLEVGKRADVVLWSRFPFSVYARPDRVYIDGALLYDRARTAPPRSDFELGHAAPRPQPVPPQPVPDFTRRTMEQVR